MRCLCLPEQDSHESLQGPIYQGMTSLLIRTIWGPLENPDAQPNALNQAAGAGMQATLFAKAPR